MIVRTVPLAYCQFEGEARRQEQEQVVVEEEEDGDRQQMGKQMLFRTLRKTAMRACLCTNCLFDATERSGEEAEAEEEGATGQEKGRGDA